MMSWCICNPLSTDSSAAVLASAIASALASANLRVALLDFDPACRVTQIFGGGRLHGREVIDVTTAFGNEGCNAWSCPSESKGTRREMNWGLSGDGESVEHHGCIWCYLQPTRHNGVSLLPGNSSMDLYETIDERYRSAIELLASVWIEHVAECEALDRFDVVISVCGDGFPVANFAALASSASLIVPLSDWSQGSDILPALDRLNSMWGPYKCPPVDIVVPMAGGRVSRPLARLRSELAHMPVFHKVVRKHEVILESVVAGMPLLEYYPGAAVTSDVCELVNVLLKESCVAVPARADLGRLTVSKGAKNRGVRMREEIKRARAGEISRIIRFLQGVDATPDGSSRLRTSFDKVQHTASTH